MKIDEMIKEIEPIFDDILERHPVLGPNYSDLYAKDVIKVIQRLAQEKPILFVPKGWFTIDKRVYILDDEDNATPFFDQVEVIENEA